MRFSVPPRPVLARAAALALAVVASSGCAGRQKIEEVAWPPPPNAPRLKYVRSIVGEADFDDRFITKLRRGVAGVTSTNVVFNPNGVALSADEARLYVTSGLGYVLCFDRVTHAVDRVANDDRDAPAKPYALAVDAAENLYVTDLMGQVYVYSRENKFLRTFGQGIVERPTGIAIDRRRQLVYVVDGGRQNSESHKVEVFAPDGRHLRTLGKKGGNPGEFLFPSYAAVSPSGDLYVADTMNARVQAFDPDGNLVAVIGSLGENFGQFGKPKGVAFDAQGNLHVVDGQTAFVQIFDKKHRLLMPYGGQATHPAFLGVPNGIAITSKNEIFVADYVGNRVNEYLLFDTRDAEPPASAPTPAAAPAPTRTLPSAQAR